MANDIRTWLENIGLGQYASVFIENDIDREILGDLSDDDFEQLGLSLGHRKRILRALGSVGSTTSQDENRSDAERRQLTVMFCDLVDSTALSVRFDAEDLRAIIGAFQKCCEGAVDKYDGKVARYGGDSLLVYFGYPQAREHDPELAVRAGMEIIDAVHAIDVWPDLTLQTRVGIATGEVVVGDLIGTGLSQEHAVIGETPNLAARLQSLAQPDSVVVSRLTRKLVGGLFEYENLGFHKLKGFEQPVESWKVDHELDVESRFDAKYLDSQLPPILGRNTEINLLEEGWQKTLRGKSCAVLVTGEAGIGKSRLVYSFKERIAEHSHTIVSYSCLPFRHDSPLLPIANHLESVAGFERDDDATAKLDKLELLVGSFTEDLQDVVPLFASMLGISASSRYPELNISPALRKARTMAALAQYLANQASVQPVLVLFEDLHWVDPTTLELLQEFLVCCADLPVLFVLTARPEFSLPIAEDRLVTVHLARLNDVIVKDLILRVAGNKPVPDEIIDQIIDRTDGVPLFVEELTKTLMESKILVERDDRFELSGSLPDFAVPETLQDSLMSRLDRMQNGKKVAQVGAAIGRSFSFKLISAVPELDSELIEAALEELTDSGLVYRAGSPPLAMYEFKHALVQDAAYSSLLRANRLEIHKQIAEALELYFPETCETQPQVLAHHYTRAKKPTNAIPNWQRAAKRAIERGNNEEALKSIETATTMLQELPVGKQRSEFELALCVSRGVSLESTRGYAAPEVEQTYARATELCDELDNNYEFVPVFLGLYVFHFVRGDLEIAREFAERCVKFSKAAKRIDGLIESNAALGFVLVYLGRLDEARKSLVSCIQLYETREGGQAFSPITAQDPSVASRAVLSILLWILGDSDGSTEQLETAFALAENLHRPINQALVHAHAAELFQLRGDSQAALEHSGKGLQIAANSGDAYWGTLCALHHEIAKSILSGSGDGITEIEEYLSQWRAAGASTNTPYFLMRIAQSQSAGGSFEQAIRTIEQAIEIATSTREELFMSPLYTMQGDLELEKARPDFKQAEEHFLQAIEIAKTQKARAFELRAINSYCRLLKAQDREEELPRNLEDVLRAFPDHENSPDIQEARGLLSG